MAAIELRWEPAGGPQNLERSVRKLSTVTEDNAEKLLDGIAEFAVERISETAEEATYPGSKLSGSIEVLEESKMERVVGSTKRYAIFVEKGRSPGSKAPPISAIKDWGKRGTESLSKSRAYIIAKTIGIKGIKPTFFFTSPIPTIKKKFEELTEGIGEIILETVKVD